MTLRESASGVFHSLREMLGSWPSVCTNAHSRRRSSARHSPPASGVMSCRVDSAPPHRRLLRSRLTTLASNSPHEFSPHGQKLRFCPIPSEPSGAFTALLNRPWLAFFVPRRRGGNGFNEPGGCFIETRVVPDAIPEDSILTG